MRILQALDEVATRNGAKPAEVALSWLIVRDGVTAPIASATSRDQLASLIKAVRLALSAEDIASLDGARLIRQWEDLPLSGAVSAGSDAFAAAYETDEPRATMRKFLAAQKARKTRS